MIRFQEIAKLIKWIFQPFFQKISWKFWEVRMRLFEQSLFENNFNLELWKRTCSKRLSSFIKTKQNVFIVLFDLKPIGRGDTMILIKKILIRIFLKNAPTCSQGSVVYQKNKNNSVEGFVVGKNGKKCQKF